jgi:hypothetical protein
LTNGATSKEEIMSAEEILKKRRMAAKGLKPTSAGKPVDPMEDPVDEAIEPPRNAKERQEKVAAGAAAGLAVRRSG